MTGLPLSGYRTASGLWIDDHPRDEGQQDDAQQARIQRGRTDGSNLIFSLAMERNLPDCLVEVPQ